MTDPASVVVSNVRVWGGEAVDIHIIGGRIERIAAHSDDVMATIDGEGMLALPGFINAHAHIDKSWWGNPWVSYGGEATTQGRIAHERLHRDELGIPGLEPTLAVLRQFLGTGTTALRTHVDVDLGVGLRGIEVVREAVATFDGAIEATIVAFPQDGVIRRPGVLELLDAAAVAGADAIGGLDPAGIDRDPVGQLDGLFRIAEHRDVGLDIHLHDGAELGAFQMELIADRTRRTGLHGRVTISHGFALGQLTSHRQAALIADLADVGISMATVAPMGIEPLPLRALHAAGIAVGLGTDGIRDLWSPYGNGDLMQLANQLARLAGFRHDEDLIRAMRVATIDGAAFVGRDVQDLAEGARADIVLLDAENPQDALMRLPPRALVIAGGTVVARDGIATI